MRKEKLLIITVSIILSGAIFMVLWDVLFAANGSPLTSTTTFPKIGPIRPPKNVVELVNYLYRIVLAVSGIIAVGQLLYAGVVWTTSQGNPAKIKEAKDRIFGTFLGLLVLLITYLLLYTINPELVRFKIPKVTPTEIDVHTTFMLQKGILFCDSNCEADNIGCINEHCRASPLGIIPIPRFFKNATRQAIIFYSRPSEEQSGMILLSEDPSRLTNPIYTECGFLTKGFNIGKTYLATTPKPSYGDIKLMELSGKTEFTITLCEDIMTVESQCNGTSTTLTGNFAIGYRFFPEITNIQKVRSIYVKIIGDEIENGAGRPYLVLSDEERLNGRCFTTPSTFIPNLGAFFPAQGGNFEFEAPYAIIKSILVLYLD